MRQQLRNLRGLGPGLTPNPAINSGYTGTPGGLPGVPSSLPGQYDTGMGTHGIEPSDADVDRYIQAMGGYPNTGPAPQLSDAARSILASISTDPIPKPPSRTGGRTAAPPHSAPPASNPMNLFQQFFGNAEKDRQEARMANEIRYQQLLNEAGGLRDRRQANAMNWGKAQAELNKQKAQESLGEQKSALQNAGILNSNVLPAFEQRNARDLALEQQDLSERRDQRASEMDAADTDRLTGFIERRTDTGPDYNALLNMALQYGQAQQAQQNAEAARKQNAEMLARFSGTGGQGTPVAPPLAAPVPQGGPLPIFTNGNPYQFAMNYLGSLAPPFMVGANGTPRTGPSHPHGTLPAEGATATGAIGATLGAMTGGPLGAMAGMIPGMMNAGSSMVPKAPQTPPPSTSMFSLPLLAAKFGPAAWNQYMPGILSSAQSYLGY